MLGSWTDRDPTGYISHLACSPDGGRLGLAGDGERLWLWAPESAREPRRLRRHRVGRSWSRWSRYADSPTAFSAEGAQLRSTSVQHLEVFDGHNGRLVRRVKLPWAHWRIGGFSPDGCFLARNENPLAVRNAASGRLLGTVPDAGAYAAVSVSNDPTLIAGRKDRRISLWNVTRGIVSPTLPTHGRIMISPNQRDLGRISGSALEVWDRDAASWISSPARFRGTPLAFCGSTVAYETGIRSALRLWDAPTGATRKVPQGDRELQPVAFAPTGGPLAIGGQRTLRLWDVNARRLVGTLDVSVGPGDLVFSPDGRWLAAYDSGRTSGTSYGRPKAFSRSLATTSSSWSYSRSRRASWPSAAWSSGMAATHELLARVAEGVDHAG
jgi:WD40 repeat protein